MNNRLDARAGSSADSPTDRHFVVEIESDGAARLRFGDDVNGLRALPETVFTASYRWVTARREHRRQYPEPFYWRCSQSSRAPILCPPPVARIRKQTSRSGDAHRKPFMTQERAITMADYVRVTEMNNQVKDAVATLRWTGTGTPSS